MTDTPKPKRARRFAQTQSTHLQPGDEAISPPVDPATPQPTVKPESKATRIVAMLQRGEGATLDEMMSETGWLRHTTRAALTGLKRKGHTITSTKTDGVRRYYAAVAQ